MNENDIIPYVEPIFRFCKRRVGDIYDAEDLAGEIICHVLEGMNRYEITSLDAWVWRIAHNRYARYIDEKKRSRMIVTDDEALYNIAEGSMFDVDTDEVEERFGRVFRGLHSLSAEYRNIFIDKYVGEMSVQELAEKYSLPETTIKWRLSEGRRKIRDRIGTGIGEEKKKDMERIYKRINWNTTTCNGSMDPDAYLHSQISRAICSAAYEKPLTIEEISAATGIPALYIEDELPNLEYGDAIVKIGNKYATDFIVFRLADRKLAGEMSAAAKDKLAGALSKIMSERADEVRSLGFYGCDFGMDRLGYIVVPYVLRHKIRTLMDRLGFERGSYPNRKDGGYGWYIVEETDDENEKPFEYGSGCNIAGDDSGSRRNSKCSDGINNGMEAMSIYYYWIDKYFDADVYHGRGTRFLCANGEFRNDNGIVTVGGLSDLDAAMLVKNGLIVRSGDVYKANFACFTDEQFSRFAGMFDINGGEIDANLTEWILAVHKSFVKFVPARLGGQINQWLRCYLSTAVGYVTDELISRGVLREPPEDVPMTYGVFGISGNKNVIEP